MPPPHWRPEKPSAPTPPHRDYPSPLLRLEIQDLSDTGARSFLNSVNAADVLVDAVHSVLDLLYPGKYRGSWPATRSVTLVLRFMPGVAYTCGKAIDDDHKEIHFSTNYISSIKPELLKPEITGVIVHEMVHCWQWNGCGSAPGGLIEGIADWVRLKADLSPPHWKRTAGDSWDAGYQNTAWFLDWLEDKYGPRTVPLLNHMLKDIEYNEKKYWRDQCGFNQSVQELWRQYKRWLSEEHEGKMLYEGDEIPDQELGREAESAIEGAEKVSTEIGEEDSTETGGKDKSEKGEESENITGED
jgi:Peptidase of plants and bacteria